MNTPVENWGCLANQLRLLFPVSKRWGTVNRQFKFSLDPLLVGSSCPDVALGRSRKPSGDLWGRSPAQAGQSPKPQASRRMAPWILESSNPWILESCISNYLGPTLKDSKTFKMIVCFSASKR